MNNINLLVINTSRWVRLCGVMLLLPLWFSCGEKTLVTEMRCEYTNSPVGIDATHPRFTWKFQTTEKNFMQQAYQLRVATNIRAVQKKNPDIWLSSKTETDEFRAVYGGDIQLQAHKKYYWNVKIWDTSGNTYESPVDSFEVAKISNTDWDARWITNKHDMEATRQFRKSFQVNKAIASARVYIAGTGSCQLFMNGEQIRKNVSLHNCKRSDKHILYVTGNVTSLLKKEENVIAVMMSKEQGNGGINPLLLCELRITYTDGTVEIVSTDNSWKTNTDNIDTDGWNTYGYNDDGWEYARIADAPSQMLQARQTSAIDIQKETLPVSFVSLPNNIYVFDMGENFSGVCRLKVKGEAGTTLALRCGESLNNEGRPESENIHFMSGQKTNEATFTLKGIGDYETFEPRFGYQGFRYVEVEADKPVKLSTDNVTGIFVHPDLPQSGNFNCSSSLLNKIWKITNSGCRNLCGVLNEYSGSSDAHMAADLALLNYDGITFYEKWMNEFIDNQNVDNDSTRFEDEYEPEKLLNAALFVIPNTLYNYYGDTRAIKALYETMEKYLNSINMIATDTQLNSMDYKSVVYYYHENKLMARFALLSGKSASSYRQKADELKALINKKYFNPETGIYDNGSQTAQALALYMELVPENKKQLVAEKLQKNVAENNYFLDFGMVGCKTVPAMLAKYGYIEDAYKMVIKTESPSWGYCAETLNYTTLTPNRTVSPQFKETSFNHVFMGDIGVWMYNALAGINIDPEAPGCKHIIVKPYFVKELDWVKAEYNSVRGMIKTSWQRAGDTIRLSVSVPAGATATIYADEKYKVGSGTHEYIIDSGKSVNYSEVK